MEKIDKFLHLHLNGRNNPFAMSRQDALEKKIYIT